ncbi:MAG: hypothetical protein ACK4ML_00975 [Alishewanella aestuarii]
MPTNDLVTPDWSGPVCIIRKESNEARVLCEHGSDKARVFESIKAGRRWIKRNIVSPAERRKLFFVPAPRA